MENYIGLRSGIDLLMYKRDFLASLKQQSLFFDKIGILGLDGCLEFDLNFTNEELLEIQWLIDKGFLYNVELQPGNIPINIETLKLAELGLKKDAERKNLMKDFYSFEKFNIVKPELDKNNHALESIALRLLAVQIENQERIQAIPLLSYKDFLYEYAGTKKVEVVEITINEIPVPKENTPWEKIFDYRTNQDVYESLVELRRWVRKTSQENLTVGELKEEIDYLRNKFNKYMKLHRIKEKGQVIETLVKAPFEALENLVKLNISKIPDPFFSLRRQQISLLEAEINAPGKEISYLIKTIEEFTDS